jgi:3-hydroxypropionate dehydrogenase (NADP+)
MMTEKRRGIATRAKANGSLVRSFRSPIYVPLPYSVSVSGTSIKQSPRRFSPRSNALSIIHYTISEDINKDDEGGRGILPKGKIFTLPLLFYHIILMREVWMVNCLTGGGMSMETHKVACVGAGLIGQEWATLFSSKGLEVVLQDLSETVLEKSIRSIRSNLQFLEKSNLLRKGETEAALKRIKISRVIGEAVCQADYVQESVPDDYELKKQVFREMDASAPDHAVLASSSSGLLMTEIQKVTTKPRRCVLVHPVLPVYLIPLVEIVGGAETSRETLIAAHDFMKNLGKVPVLLKREVSGYIVNRLQAALLREAVDLVDKDVASAEDVDKAFRVGIGLRDPLIGPFLRIHLAGGGVERFIKNFSQSYRHRWETMETWTSIPPSAAEKIVRSVREMGVVRQKTLEEIKDWRDEMLVKLLKLMRED